MTDIIPNDLSHMSDEDFNALCPQGHHAPGPEPLSPAAQTVLAAYYCEKPLVGSKRIAAALRAAADQVVPEHPMVVPGGRSYESAWSATVQEDIRKKFLAIAAELEGHD